MIEMAIGSGQRPVDLEDHQLLTFAFVPPADHLTRCCRGWFGGAELMDHALPEDVVIHRLDGRIDFPSLVEREFPAAVHGRDKYRLSGGAQYESENDAGCITRHGSTDGTEPVPASAGQR